MRGRCVLGRVLRKVGERAGQSTVEAAFMIPLVFGGMLMLIQPGILLYDRVVMENAAAEGCRVLSTASGSEAGMARDYVHRRLGAIPPQDNFHCHEPCSWEIDVSGSQSSKRVSVRISTKVRPIPLVDFALRGLGATDSDGTLTVEVRAEQMTQPTWAFSSPAGSDASVWAGAWLE